MLLARKGVTETVLSLGFPILNLKQISFNNRSILDGGDNRHDIEVGRNKKNSIC